MYLEDREYSLEFKLLVSTGTDFNVLNDDCIVRGRGVEVDLEEIQRDVAKEVLDSVRAKGSIGGADQDGRITYYNFDKVESVTFDFMGLKECD